MKILSILILILFYSNSLAQINDWEKMNLKNRVKVLTEEDDFKKHKTRYFFNEKGYIIKKQRFLFSKIRENQIYLYKNNKLVEINNNDIKYTFYYDENGSISKEIIENNSKNTTYRYKYNDSNKKKEMIGYNNRKEKFITQKFKYDKKGEIIEFTEEHGNIIKKELYRYIVKNGLLIEKNIKEFNNNKLVSNTKIKYFYNEEKRLIKEKQGNTTEKYAYDSKMNWIKKQHSPIKKWMVHSTTKCNFLIYKLKKNINRFLKV